MSHSSQKPSPKAVSQHSIAILKLFQPKPLHSEPSFDNRRDPDSEVQSLVRELQQDNIWDYLLSYIRSTFDDEAFSREKIIRDLVFEIADKPQLSIEALVYAAGFNVFGSLTIRQHAARLGCSPEGFSKRVDDFRRRFRLPVRTVGRIDS